MHTSDVRDRIRIDRAQTVSDTWVTFRRYAFALLGRDGSWRESTREVLEHRDAAAVLPYSARRGTVFLVRQFRLPVYLRDPDQALSLEVPSGLLDAEPPDRAALRELAEETGFRLSTAVHVFTGYLAPTLLSQRMHLYVADVDAGVAGEAEPDDGEDIEVVELSMATVVQLIARGEIRDAKTVLLIQQARLMGLLEPQSRQTGAT